MVYYDRNESLSFKKCYLRSFLVVDNIQNPKLDEFRVLYYIFFRLTKHYQMTKMWVNFVSILCSIIWQNDETKLITQISNRFCLLSTTTIESDKIQNTKQEIWPALYFINHPLDESRITQRTITNTRLVRIKIPINEGMKSWKCVDKRHVTNKCVGERHMQR